MQLTNTKIGSVIQGGIAETTNFTIEADGTMFRLLSDTLYQNKIGSMIREVSCNAVDAHVMAGKGDVPFIIHAPTSMEPWFSVIDEGIGLSHDDVVKIFTCFGKSTKRTSNTVVGAFGFGSKTPFAYTNAFTVISVKDGIKSSYSAVVGEDGMPAMNLMGSEATEQGNGVEITVAVESYDFNEFYNEIAHQLRHFKVKPIILGRNISFPDPYKSVIEKIDDHTFFRQHVYNAQIEVVQGGVAYPVDLAQLEKGIGDNESLRKFLHGAVQSYNPIFIFDIGMIGVTPSRESISYDQVTIKNILDRIESVRKILIQRLTDKMEAATSLWDRAIILKKNCELYNQIIDFSNNPWNVPVYGDDPYIALPDNFKDYVTTGDGRVRHLVSHYQPKESASGKFRLTEVSDDTKHIIPGSNVAIIVDDSSGYAMSRIRRYAEETDKSIYFLTAKFQKMRTFKRTLDDGTEESYTHADGGWVNTNVDPTMFAAFVEAMDGCPLIFLADLPKQERVYVVKNDDGTETVKEKYVPAKAYKFVGHRQGYGFKLFKNYEKTFVAPKKMTEKAAYVIVNNRSIESGLIYQDETLLRHAMANNEFDLTIYAIREQDAEKIKDNPNWITLAKAMENLRAILEAKYKHIHARFAVSVAGENIERFGNNTLMDFLVLHKERVADTMLRGVLRRYNRFQKHSKKNINEICKLLYTDSIDKIRERMAEKNGKRNTDILDRYPIFNMIGNSYYTRNREQAMEQFLEMINLHHANKLAS